MALTSQIASKKAYEVVYSLDEQVSLQFLPVDMIRHTLWPWNPS
jgi:hypothetical protein